MSWLWPSIIDSGLSPTKERWMAINRDADRLWKRNRRNFVLFVLFLLSCLPVFGLVFGIGGTVATMIGLNGSGLHIQGLTSAVLVLLYLILGMSIVLRCRYRPCLYKAARWQGLEVCTECGYSLRGLDDEVRNCPECGTRRERLNCPRCEGKMAFLDGRGVTCEECGYSRTGVPFPPLIPKFGPWRDYLWIDPKLFVVISRSELWQLRRHVLAQLGFRQLAIIVTVVAILLLLLLYCAIMGDRGFSLASENPGSISSLYVIPTLHVLAVGTLMFGSVVVLFKMIGRVYGRPLRRLIREEGYEVCVWCGHWLVDMRADAKECPACGTVREGMGPRKA